MYNGIQQQLRVAVQLIPPKEATIDDCGSDDEDGDISANTYNPPLTLFRSLQIVDSETLKIEIKPGLSITKRFDLVSFAKENVLNSQVSLLIDELFSLRHNCKLLYFDGEHNGSHLISLIEMLLSEVDKRFEQIEANISKITLMYAKSDSVKLREQRGDTGDIDCSLSRTCHFFNTIDLIQWLLNVCRVARSTATVFESIEIRFRITANTGVNGEHTYDTKLVICDLYFTKMDRSLRKQLYEYVIPDKDRSVPFRHSELTLLLREQLEDEAEASKLLFCNIYEDNLCSETDALLLTVIINVHEKFGGVIKPLNFALRQPCSCLNNNINETSLSLLKPRAIYFNIPFNEHCHNTRRSTNRLSHKQYSDEDLRKLQVWYQKLDDSFADARRVMEEYYVSKYNIMISKLCHDVKMMSVRAENAPKKQNPNSKDREQHLKAEAENHKNLEDVFKKCNASLQEVVKELDGTRYAEELKVYYCTKNFAHNQFILTLKRDQLKTCKQRINDALNMALRALDKEI